MKFKRKRESSGNWMDTYGDMVTLLLCFFVLLYSISSVDQTKWVNLVKSLNPNAKETSQVVMDESIKPGKEEVPGGTEGQKKFDQIAENVKDQMSKLGVNADVNVVQGEGYHLVSYKDKVFFDGDKASIKKEGKRILDGFCRAIKPSAKTIKEIQIFGHTSQATEREQNDIEFDRQLSSERSANVVIYIQKKNIIEPSRLTNRGYGQFHPIATFATPEGRQKNRRAEILITEKGSEQKDLTDYYEDMEKNKKKEAEK